MMPERDPLDYGAIIWPHARFYGKQEEMVYSVEYNIETYVISANQMGKDYVSAFIAVNLFLRCLLEDIRCRIITTSVKDDHLRVLWAEIGRWLSNAATPLLARDGGPLLELNKEIRRATEKEMKNPDNYIQALVSETGEGLSGHHAECTLIIGDEASAIPDSSYRAAQGWAKRFLFFGNAWDCENFFKKGIEGGDLQMSDELVIPNSEIILAA